jgi:hypothetical protein
VELGKRTQYGADQPPKNNKAFNVDVMIIFPYSARKNIAKIIEEYSTL